MDVGHTLTFAAVLAGATELLKHVFPDKVSGWVTVIVVVVLGLVAGFAHLDGLTPLTGILTAFASVGGMTALNKVGGN